MTIYNTDQESWKRIAEAYKEVIVPYPEYQRFMLDILLTLVGRKTILDLGCGPGFLVNKLLEDNERYVIGVDSSSPMLRIAVDDFIDKSHHGRFELHHGDAAVFDDPRRFDAVVSTNVLFNLERPMDYLDNSYKLLKEGGILVVSSPFEGIEVSKRKALMEQYYQSQGLYEAKKNFIDQVWEVNANLMHVTFNTYAPASLAETLLQHIGFDRILHNGTTYNQNFLIVAEKVRENSPLRFEITNCKQRMVHGLKLRTHYLIHRMRTLPLDSPPLYVDGCEDHCIGAFAIDAQERVVAFMNYVQPTMPNPPFNNKCLLLELRKKYGTIGFFNGFYVMGTRRYKKIGSFLHAEFMSWVLKNQPVDAIVTEAVPEVLQFIQKFGGKVVGEPFPCTGKKKATVHPVLFDMRASGLETLIENHRKQYYHMYGIPELKVAVF